MYLFLFVCCAKGQRVLSLDEAIKLALQNSYDIQVSKNDAEIAAVNNSWALAGRYPTVGIDVAYTATITNLQQNLSNGTVTKRNGTFNRNLQSGISGDMLLFNGYRVANTKRRLEVLQETGVYNLKQQSNQTVFDVITNYYNVARLQKQLTALQENIKLFEERVKLSKARFDIGTAAKNDYLQSQVDLNDQKNSMLVMEKDMLEAQTALNNLVSRDPDTKFVVNDSVDVVILPSKSEAIENLDSLNPQILAAKTNETAILYQNRIIRAQRAPSISIGAGGVFNRAQNGAGLTLLNQTVGPQAGVTLSIPLFTGGIVKRQLQINDIELKTQKVQTASLRNDLRTSLVNAYNEYDNAKRQYELQQQSLALIQENSFIAMERFRRAAITLVDLRQVQISLVTTQTNLINARYTMKLDEVSLQYLTGTLVN